MKFLFKVCMLFLFDINIYETVQMLSIELGPLKIFNIFHFSIIKLMGGF